MINSGRGRNRVFLRESFAAALKLCEKPGFLGLDALRSVKWAIHARDRCAARTLDNLQKKQGAIEKNREHLSFAFIVRASPLASCTIRERGRSHYNKKMLFTKLRCSQKISPQLPEKTTFDPKPPPHQSQLVPPIFPPTSPPANCHKSPFATS